VPGDTTNARRAVDAMLSKGYADADILDAALEGFVAAASTTEQKRALVDTFAKYGCVLARCRRPVWKGCVLEMGVLEAFIAASDAGRASEDRSHSEPESDQESHCGSAVANSDDKRPARSAAKRSSRSADKRSSRRVDKRVATSAVPPADPA
jgi:hypothetical protein